MTYTVPPAPPEPKLRLVRVHDPDIIAAVRLNDLRAPIGAFDSDGACWVEHHSLQQYLGKPVEFSV